MQKWSAVRSVVLHPETSYEERVTVWVAENEDEAIVLGEREADEYAKDVNAINLGLSQVYTIGEKPESGVEVFSLIRKSDLAPSNYLEKFLIRVMSCKGTPKLRKIF